MSISCWNGTAWTTSDTVRVWTGTEWTSLSPLYWDEEWLPSATFTNIVSTSVTVSWDVAASTPTTKTYTVTKSWSANWSSTYFGNNNKRTDNTGLYQGYTSYSSGNGNMKSLVGFTVGSFPAGSTCTSCKLVLNAEHWYYNSGGTAILGTHDKASEPSTFSSTGTDDDRLRYDWTSKTGQRTITLGNTIGNEFISGSTKGIMIGPGPSTSSDYYGYFTGTGSLRPTLQMTYTYVA